MFGMSSYTPRAIPQGPQIMMVSAGENFTLGLKNDGTCIMAGGDSDDSAISGMTGESNLIQISAGYDHALGLKSDGTVVAYGESIYGQLNVGSWTDIVQISAGVYISAGVESDGTVVAVGGYNITPNVSSWTNVKQVSCGTDTILAVDDSGGTYLQTAYNIPTSGWTNITQVDAYIGVGPVTIIGLSSNNTIYYSRDSGSDGSVTPADPIKQVKATRGGFLGLKADGTTYEFGTVFGDTTSWSDVIQISVGGDHCVGLKSDGSVLATGNNSDGQLNVGSWDLRG